MKKIFFLFFITFFANIAFAAVPPVSTPVDNYAILEGSPARIATDSSGKLYVTNNTRGLISVFSNNGLLLYSINTVKSPLGIAVDSLGKIFVSDIEKKNVGIYDSKGNLLLKLGSGDGEFGLPNDVAVSSSGNVYVTDSINNIVKVYSFSLSSRRSGGTYTNTYSFGAGLLNFPTGAAVDDSAGEVFVIDHNNLYIRVFDLNGNLKRSIKGGGGMMGGKLLRPLGIAVDSTRMYVTDIFHSVVAAYDKVSGIFLRYIGNYGAGNGEFKSPIGLAIDKDNKIFVASNENQRIEVLGIDTFNSLKIDPNTLNFFASINGSTITQTVNLTSTISGTAWTAVVSSPWITLSSNTGITPSSVNVTVNPAGLSQGHYTSEIKFQTQTGLEYVLIVSLEVQDLRALSVAPGVLRFAYQKNSGTLQTNSLMISSSGSILQWNASTPTTRTAFLKLSNSTGITPATLNVTLSDNVKYFPLGSYETTIDVNAGTVQGSPAQVRVYLDVIETTAIRVITNLDSASYTITGPDNLSGFGKEWVSGNVNPGTYVITYNPVSGYRSPDVGSFTVNAGGTTEITGVYSKVKTATHIIAGSADPNGNTLRVLPLDGSAGLTITPFYSPSVVKIAAGDLDGDGIDEIIATNSRNIINIYSADGNMIAAKFLESTADKLEIVVADINQDGKAEILAGYIITASRTKKLISFNLEGSLFVNEVILMYYTDSSRTAPEAFAISTGDIDSDGKSELVVAEKSKISSYKFNPNLSLTVLWSKMLSETVRPVIITGDIDGDGKDEIAIASGPVSTNPSQIRFLKGDGTDYGLQFNAFGDLNYMYGATVSLADIDGDGVAEIAAGAGPGSSNEALIRLFEGDGQYISQIKAMDNLYGVNISFGKFQ